MRQIALVAGIAVGGIYNHYSSKEEIFAAVLDAYHPYHVVLPALEGTEGETVEAFVRDAANRVRAGFAGAETKLLPLIFTELVEFQGRHLKQMAELLLPTLLAFAKRFPRRKGRLRPIPISVMLLTFMALLVSSMLTEMILKDTPIVTEGDQDWFSGMLDIYLHGILASEQEA